MTILFDSRRSVKPRRPARVFAQGVPTSEPKRQPFSSADLAWAAQHLNQNTRDYVVVSPAPEPDYDRMAAESEAMAAYEAGHWPW